MYLLIEGFSLLKGCSYGMCLLIKGCTPWIMIRLYPEGCSLYIWKFSYKLWSYHKKNSYESLYLITDGHWKKEKLYDMLLKSIYRVFNIHSLSFIFFKKNLCCLCFIQFILYVIFAINLSLKFYYSFWNSFFNNPFLKINWNYF